MGGVMDGRYGAAHRVLVGLLVEGLPKDGHNKEVDEE